MSQYTFVYSGPVKSFGAIVNPNWKGITVAPSRTKALSNLCYQYKKKTGKSQNYKVTLLNECLKNYGEFHNKF